MESFLFLQVGSVGGWRPRSLAFVPVTAWQAATFIGAWRWLRIYRNLTACRPTSEIFFRFDSIKLLPLTCTRTVAKTKTGISFVLQHKRPQPACYTPGCTRAPPQTPADRHRPRRRAPTPGSQRTHTRRPQRTATGIDTNYHSNVYSHSLSPSFI